jgi:hypothetical protein
MSKGDTGLKSITQVDQLDWLASVKVGSKRGSNSSETGSVVRSRMNSQSRPPGNERSGSDIGTRQRSGSLSWGAGDERKDGGGGQSLQDEFVLNNSWASMLILFFRITSVLTKLAPSKITLEKVGLLHCFWDYHRVI